jgi:hypothetical protein
MHANPKVQGITQHIEEDDVPKDVWKIDWVNVAT